MRTAGGRKWTVKGHCNPRGSHQASAAPGPDEGHRGQRSTTPECGWVREAAAGLGRGMAVKCSGNSRPGSGEGLGSARHTCLSNAESF